MRERPLEKSEEATQVSSRSPVANACAEITVIENEKMDLEALPSAVAKSLPVAEIKLSLADVSPIKPLWLIVRRKNNVVILISSGKLLLSIFMLSY